MPLNKKEGRAYVKAYRDEKARLKGETMKDNLGLLTDNGFSPERNELFKEIIDYISEKSLKEDRSILIMELHMIPSTADLDETIKKAIKHYALPNGICIVKDPSMNAYYRIRSGVQYKEWVETITERISALNEMKAIAAAAWMNDRRGLEK
jgi:hypothetical protein